ncbi:uncharacterized protein [Musca autumnalis]|uniref:uncharacterized protein n=1 Tax=Musca autumnalis TaxID=221902 RepID=UPI003CF2560F
MGFTILDDPAVVVKNEPIIDIEFEDSSMREIEESSVQDKPTIINETDKILDECTGHLKVETDTEAQVVDGSSTDEAEEGNDEMLEVYEIVEEEECDTEEDEMKTCVDESVPPFVSSFMESRTNVIALITSYKKHLQDKGLRGHADDNGLKTLQESDWNKLTNDINNKCHLNLSSEDVANILEYFYQQYKEYLMCLTDSKTTKYSKPHWYFEYLDFLDRPNEANIFQIDDHSSILSQEEIIIIIDIYKQYPYLWNTNLAEYCCTNPRHESLENMIWNLEVQLNLKVSQSALKKYLRCIHNYYQKEKQRRMKSTKMEYVADVLYDKMSFLSKHVGPFKCPDCDLEIKCPFTLKIHKFGIHGGELPFTCSTCQSQFRSLNSYVFHVKKHVQDLSIECKICDRRFVSSNDLKKHMLSHSEYKIISNEANRIHGAQRIRKEKSSSASNVVFITKVKTAVNSPTSSKQMVEPSTSNLSGSIACKVCGVQFKARKSLNQHMRIHIKK